jgi:glutathione S-transferase
MADYPDITLRYFPVRGRGQAIRGLLSAREVPFTDKHIILNEDFSSWRKRDRNDRSISGPFQKVPTLEWGGLMVSEVLVIMDFLHRKLGDAESLDEEQNLRHAMLTSSAFLDLLTPSINIVWCDFFNPGADVPKTAAMVKAKLGMHLATVDQTLTEWHWLNDLEQRPVMAADAMLWEALDYLLATFDGAVSLDEHETLKAFHEHCPGKAAFEAHLEKHPVTMTARPGEAEALAAIRG